VGRVVGVVMYRIDGHGVTAVLVQRLARVGVDVKAREIAARDIYADAVAFLKNI